MGDPKPLEILYQTVELIHHIIFHSSTVYIHYFLIIVYSTVPVVQRTPDETVTRAVAVERGTDNCTHFAPHLSIHHLQVTSRPKVSNKV